MKACSLDMMTLSRTWFELQMLMLSPLTEQNNKSDCNYSKQLQYVSDIGTYLTKSGENESTHPLRAVTAFPRWFPGLWFCDLMLYRYSTDVIFQTTNLKNHIKRFTFRALSAHPPRVLPVTSTFEILRSRCFYFYYFIYNTSTGSSGRATSTCSPTSTVLLRDPQVAWPVDA